MTLLKLARNLIARARQDEMQPIPMVFNLSSWAEKRQPIADWLIERLSIEHQIPRALGKAWVDAEQVLPLLDGLDEVKREHRAACVEVINQFRQEHRQLSIVVCSRTADYRTLTTQLRLQGQLSCSRHASAD